MRQALVLAEEAGVARGALRSCMNLSYLLVLSGKTAEAEEIIERGLEEVEDYYDATRVLERVRRGEEPVHSLSEVERGLGLADVQPELAGEIVAECRGSDFGNGNSARCHNQSVGSKSWALCLSSHHLSKPTVWCSQWSWNAASSAS